MEIQDIQDNFIFLSDRDIVSNENYVLHTFLRLEIFINKLIQTEKKYILFDCLDEFEPPSFIPDYVYQKINGILKSKNKYLIFLLGSPNQIKYNTVPWVQSNINKICIPSASILWTIQEYHNRKFFNESENKNKTDDNPKYFIRCFNRYPHEHRCILIDLLAKNNLIENNYISWNFLNQEFDFKYFKQKKITADYDLSGMPGQQNQVMFNDKIIPTVFDLVTESNTEFLFYSEKTWKSYLQNNSISIFLGHRNQNLSLKKYGFEMYDEIIDYTFDTLDTYEERANHIVNQLKILSKNNHQELIDKVRDKIYHNYENVIKIYKSNQFIPNEIIHLVSNSIAEYLNETIFVRTVGHNTLKNIDTKYIIH